MRLLPIGFLGLAVLAAPHARAQESRFSVEPFVARTSPSAIYDKTTTFSAGESEVERLSVSAAPTVGLRFAYRIAPAWSVSAEASRGSADYRYSYLAPSLEEQRWGSASITSMLVSVERTILASANGIRLDAQVMGGVQRLSIEKGDAFCPPPSGGVSVCFTPERWQDDYDVSSAGAGLALSKSLTSRVGVRTRASYSIGRADTTPFWTDLIPAADQYEADRSNRVGVLQLSVGLGIGI